MKAYYHHIGSPGNLDLRDTVMKKRTMVELLTKLPTDSHDRVHYSKDGVVARAGNFIAGEFRTVRNESLKECEPETYFSLFLQRDRTDR